MNKLIERCITPAPTTGERPTASDPTSLYIRSFLILRIMVGSIGVLLPFVLVLIDRLVLGERPFFRDSLSAYYYSGMRDVFVGALCAVGIFLIAYKVVELSLDNTLSTIAGFCAVGIALFPTDRGPYSVPLTPVQNLLGETLVRNVHFASAFAFIGLLAALCICFGVREGRRGAKPKGRAPQFWRAFHFACAGVIGLAVVFILVAGRIGDLDQALLIGEAVSIWAFGLSWLMKGLELDALRGAPVTRAQPEASPKKPTFTDEP